jgi:hypothetical protein
MMLQVKPSGIIVHPSNSHFELVDQSAISKLGVTKIPSKAFNQRNPGILILHLYSSQCRNLMPCLMPLFHPKENAAITKSHVSHLLGLHRRWYRTYRLDWAGQLATIDVLPEEMILEMFHFFKLACGNSSSEWQKEWHKLAHVCKRWRTIIFASQHILDLRLLCTPKTSIEMTLDLWPAFPVVVQYACGWLSPDDRDKITTVLQRNDRVCEINLDLYHPLSEKESQIMQETFPLLECFTLCSWQAENPVLPNTFLNGSAPRLNVLHLYGIDFPALPRFLSSACDLVDLLLDRISSAGYLSPEALAGGLSATPRLKTLSLNFARATSHPNPMDTPPPSSGRITLSALIDITFNGPCRYLEDLLSRISAPSLKCAKIQFVGQPCVDISQLSQFLGRVKSQRLPNTAKAVLYLPDTCIYLPRLGAGALQASSPNTTSKWLSLSITFRARFDLFQICQQLSPFLSSVRTLDIHTSSCQPDEDFSQWLGIFYSFSRVERLHITGSSAPKVAHALQIEMAADLLPALRELTLDPYTHVSNTFSHQYKS